MSVSTDGQICFGVLLEEGAELPWNDESYDGDIENWWLAINGFKSSVEIYDEKGEYIGGKRPDDATITKYFDEKHDFLKKHPVLELVNYCSGDYPMYILAVPRTVLSASRGYPHEFNPSLLYVTDNERNSLVAFCKEHGLEVGEPRWYLSSYWG